MPAAEPFWHGISIHALRVEGDWVCDEVDLGEERFLSTPSGWRATTKLTQPEQIRFISIHALRVEGDVIVVKASRVKPISIHALRVEGDLESHKIVNDEFVISIHALRVEGDASSSTGFSSIFYFYPRPPGGGRPTGTYSYTLAPTDFYPRPPGGGRRKIRLQELEIEIVFLSTPSGWRATIAA